MNMLFIPLQAQAAQPTAGGQAGFWVMILLLFGVMYFFMIRPQRKQQRELETFRAGLKKGDKVITTGGIYGVVDEVTDKTVLIKVDGDVKLRMDKSAIIKDYNNAQ
jgi:preprotein translocase subunit YajC